MARLIIKQLQTEQVYDFEEGVVVIGRATDNAVPINEGEASRKHCQIEKTSGGCRLLDLGSKNGTKVNGKTVQNHALRSGDIIQIGQVQITYQETAGASAKPEPAGATSTTVSGESRADRMKDVEDRAKKRWNIASLVVALLFVLTLASAILAATLSHHQFEYSEAEKLLREAAALEATDKSGAIQKLKEVPRYYPQLYTQAMARLRVLEPTDEAHKRLEASPEEIESFDFFSEFARESPQEFDRILKLAGEFKQKFPTSKFFKEVDDAERQARETREQTMNKKFVYVKANADSFMKNQEVGNAADALAEFQKKFPEYAEAEAEKKKIVDMAHQLYDECDRKAQDLISQGKRMEADTVYHDVMFKLDAPSKPFEDLVLAAQNRRKKINEQK